MPISSSSSAHGLSVAAVIVSPWPLILEKIDASQIDPYGHKLAVGRNGRRRRTGRNANDDRVFRPVIRGLDHTTRLAVGYIAPPPTHRRAHLFRHGQRAQGGRRPI